MVIKSQDLDLEVKRQKNNNDKNTIGELFIVH